MVAKGSLCRRTPTHLLLRRYLGMLPYREDALDLTRVPVGRRKHVGFQILRFPANFRRGDRMLG